MRWDYGFARSHLALIEHSWYLKVHHRKFCMKHLQEERRNRFKKKFKFFQSILLVGAACVVFTFLDFILAYFSYSDQIMRSLNNCKMGQQENSVGLDPFKLNSLNSADEQQHTILFKSVCCNFN